MQPKEQITDQELIVLCLEGKDAGYTGLYNRYARRIYNSISRIVAHTGEAEDILQETFFTVFSEPEKLKGLVSFEAWLRRLAINRAINHLRKRKIVFADLGEMEPVAEEDYDVNENEIFECKVEDVKRSIENLPDGYRTILNLYLFEKMNQEEIAAMLGISHATVRTQYHRAKKKIVAHLKDKSYYE
ncbi:RNA polymerase sigma factor [Pedobacter mendelii]|uniref:RNA polymerase subunit sigma-24 n=1 Tax=Pedobacter mendelii TaxID=1908240 RepID=A0ABQ2BG19_9SPHI|nr:RNA polymerase sigma factor [Pedobacter mendelii]GGI23257.1 RNA polymerase subunit sigma-24 [Pedobacter mendelii]